MLSQVPQGSDHFPQPPAVFFQVQPTLPSAPGHAADPSSSYCPPGPLSFTANPSTLPFPWGESWFPGCTGAWGYSIPGAEHCISPKLTSWGFYPSTSLASQEFSEFQPCFPIWFQLFSITISESALQSLPVSLRKALCIFTSVMVPFVMSFITRHCWTLNNDPPPFEPDKASAIWKR